jgi:hypothetical protein
LAEVVAAALNFLVVLAIGSGDVLGVLMGLEHRIGEEAPQRELEESENI